MDPSMVPDGGWGWVIVAAVAFINMTNQSILSVYGLLFDSQFKGMDNVTSIKAFITNFNSLAISLSGLFIGPVIKSFKPRSVATLGCMMVSFGLLFCVFAEETWHFVVGYGLIMGIGIGLISSSTFVAINSYFSSKRGRAVGVSLAGAGVGQIILPHVVRVFLQNYGFRTAILAMSILSLTGVLGALLLKPFKQQQQMHNNRKHIKLISTNDKQVYSPAEDSKKDDATIMEIKIVTTNQSPLADNEDKDKLLRSQQISLIRQKTENVEPASSSNRNDKLCQKICSRLVEAMDLELLQDPIFLSIIIGMALVYTSTVNFTMIFPSFLEHSVNLSKKTTANCMSIMAGADNICRILLPCITDKLKIPYRLIFLLGTVGLLISRSALAESMDLTTIIVMCIFTGMAKSATVLNNNLTISGHCKPEKLPGGLGLNMLAKGAIVISVGQLAALIKDATDSYISALHTQNAILLFVICVWAPEIFFKYRKHLKQKAQINDPQQAVESAAAAQASSAETESCLKSGRKEIC